MTDLFGKGVMWVPIRDDSAFYLIFCLTRDKIYGLCGNKVHMCMVFVSFLADERDKFTEKGVVA